jgi:L-cysteine S-thiosulfotransferase
VRVVVSAMLIVAALGRAAAAPDRIEAPLDGLSGDPGRGRAIVLNRQKGLCLLCHSGPFPEQRSQGDLAPDLAGVGARLDIAQLRLRIVDSRRIDPASIMPAYYRTEGLTRVAAPFRGKPILGAQDVEDVVAFLSTLR